MLSAETTRKFPDNQRRILELLLQKPYQQKHLAEALAISGAGLLYHLNFLENARLIQKKTLMEVGNVSVNEISIDPSAFQRARQIIGRKTGKYTLITGFGKTSELGDSYTIPMTTHRLLSEQGYIIDRVVAFITHDSDLAKAKQLLNIDRELPAIIDDYRNIDSEMMRRLESVIQEEQREQDVILDVTPLTKLFTMRLLEISNKYHIPSTYLGKNAKKENVLLWIHQVPANV